MAEKNLEELKVMFEKINDNADKEISNINHKIEGLKAKKEEVEYARASLLNEIRQKINEATIEEYRQKLLK